MKANEIQIGDWVYSTFCDKPCKVVGVEQYESGYANVKVTNVSGAKDITSLTPIPLTTEILEKNGFVVESKYCHSPLQYCILVDGLWIDISGENYFEGKLEYVHQLQQVLRLCGINHETIL